ncbi:hypothetical protein G7Y89_g3437 [Cudoniella acicularis]|uniref:Monocarboxylate transporter n=1 Tax=Cudoniella acicularis TaxID=354080 RepID=A0A8H4RUB9_9HELO|nr:hypothetical protein G7Y89_g3437 [Cudoniella acicularis]
MSRNGSVPVRELLPMEFSGEQQLNGAEQAAPLDQQANPRQRESNRKRACVLLGSAILQLPIWGFAMTYGVFQEFYSDNWTLKGSRDLTGIVGTVHPSPHYSYLPSNTYTSQTSNGVMYLSMPLLFYLFTKRLSQHRQLFALLGTALTALSFILSSLSTTAWHLVLTQGVLAALGSALVYSPTTLSLGEWFNTHNRALAYGLTLSCKNIVGSTCPFLIRTLLDHHGFRVTLRVWAAIAIGTSIPGIWLIPTPPSTLSPQNADNRGHRERKIPWHFLKYKTFYIHTIGTLLQSSGYGLPQTYLSTYAREITSLSQTSSTLLLTLFNIPGTSIQFFLRVSE